jgi:hypothetical protein
LTRDLRCQFAERIGIVAGQFVGFALVPFAGQYV